MINGIHHITAISSSPQKTYDFYSQILGLRLVKKTVNFDSPDVYHLYFGNEGGEPGTVLTFFPFEDAGTGMRGLGQVTKIYFEISQGSIGFWLDRFITKGVKNNGIRKRFDESYITFYDFDGLQLELVTSQERSFEPYSTQEISLQNAIRGFFGAELSIESEESIKDTLNAMGYQKEREEELFLRYKNNDASGAKYLDLLIMKGWPEAISSAGTVHHIAFRVKDREEETKLRDEISKLGFRPTEIIDRNYFYSVYFRERNNILFEIATDEPGFLVDEDLESLGTSLKLPTQFESQRSYIESILTDLYTEREPEDHDDDITLFSHSYLDQGSEKLLVLFHGTGGDEREMIKFAKNLGIKINILSVRGNIKENGLSRFFKRESDGTFDIESIREECAKFERFLRASILKYGLEEENISFLGYSNGANFALAYALLYPILLKKIYALHPMAPVTEVKSNLQGTKIIVTYGVEDEYSTEKEIKKLDHVLSMTKAERVFQKFEGGHNISIEEMDFLSEEASI